MRLTISPLAGRDLEALGDYIADDDPDRAIRFIARLRAQFATITMAPLGYRMRPELGAGIRSCAHGNYVIFFTATKTRVTIVRVLHGPMDIEAQFSADPE